MKNLAAILILSLTLAVAACSAPGQSGVDLGHLAEQIELVRLDVADLAPAATPSTQEKLAKLDKAVVKIEDALNAAAKGGPISDVRTAAVAALSVADEVIQELQAQGQYTGDWALYVGLAKVAIRHLSAGETFEASDALTPPPEQK